LDIFLENQLSIQTFHPNDVGWEVWMESCFSGEN